jgi:hypothetical protein
MGSRPWPPQNQQLTSLKRSFIPFHSKTFWSAEVRFPAETCVSDGHLLDHTCCVYVHEHAEANSHKSNGLAIRVAGGGVKENAHTKSHNSIGDVYLTIENEVPKTPIGKEFPTAQEKISGII